MVIDNVGLYRVFGLPTVAWDWEAMFQGLTAGKAMQTASMRNNSCMTSINEETASEQENSMEVIMSHEQLLADIGNLKDVRPMQADNGELKAWQDKDSGLWGLKRGKNRTTEAMFATVFDIRYDMAAVKFKNKGCGIVNDKGEAVWKNENCLSVRFLKDGLLLVKAYRKECYVDLHSLHAYMRRPKVRKLGNAELLEIEGIYYSRTKKVYVSSHGVNMHLIHWRKFYLTIYDENVPFPSHNKEYLSSESYSGHVCILEGDHDGYYWLYYWLADGSIIVADNDRRYYHATKGRPKRYIGCRDSEEEWDRCRAEILLLARKTEEEWSVMETERIEKRRQQLAESEEVVPFQSGSKMGLKAGDRVIVPPIYRMVRFPVGVYCAVEKNYGQWGIISIDGTVLVETKYSDVSIEGNDTALLTQVTGKTVSVKLR